MVEFFEFGQENPTEQVIYSRKNTPEEKRKQRWEWKKKKQEKSYVEIHCRATRR